MTSLQAYLQSDDRGAKLLNKMIILIVLFPSFNITAAGVPFELFPYLNLFPITGIGNV